MHLLPVLFSSARSFSLAFEKLAIHREVLVSDCGGLLLIIQMVKAGLDGLDLKLGLRRISPGFLHELVVAPVIYCTSFCPHWHHQGEREQ